MGRAEEGTIFVVRGSYPTSPPSSELHAYQFWLGESRLRELRRQAAMSLDRNVSNELLDLAKHGQWKALFPRLAAAENSRGDISGARYVDYLPPPRRFGLLHYAVQQGHLDAVRHLVDKCHASLDVPTSDGRAVEDIARGSRGQSMLELLERRRAAVGPMTKRSRSTNAGEACSVPGTNQNDSCTPAMPDLSVVHHLLDLAKASQWNELWEHLHFAEEGRSDSDTRYANCLPAPRRYALIHFAAAQNNVRALERLIDKFGASIALRTSDGQSVTDVANEFKRGEVLAFLAAC